MTINSTLPESRLHSLFSDFWKFSLSRLPTNIRCVYHFYWQLWSHKTKGSRLSAVKHFIVMISYHKRNKELSVLDDFKALLSIAFNSIKICVQRNRNCVKYIWKTSAVSYQMVGLLWDSTFMWLVVLSRFFLNRSNILQRVVSWYANSNHPSIA